LEPNHFVSIETRNSLKPIQQEEEKFISLHTPNLFSFTPIRHHFL